MERRKFIKGIAAAAGIICARPRILALGQDQTSSGKSRALPCPAEAPHAPAKRVTVLDGVLDNGVVRAKVDSKNGNIVELMSKRNEHNLVDTSLDQAVNKYLFLEGKDTSKVSTSGPVRIAIEESGPLVATIRIESSAPGCVELVRRVRLKAYVGWIELSNTVNKKRAPLNPHPGKDGPAGDFAQRGSKESVQFAFRLPLRTVRSTSMFLLQ